MNQREGTGNIEKAVVESRKIIRREKKIRRESVSRENDSITKVALLAGTSSSYINKLIKGGR